MVANDAVVRAEWVEMLPAVGELAGKIAGTDFVPKGLRGNVAAVAACILTGHELGLGPMLALRGIVVIQGRVTISGELLGGMVLARGHALEWGESTPDAATVTLTRGDGLGSATVTYTMDMARRAGLTRNDTYKHHPEAMLRARALGAVVKMIAPDVSLGLESAAPDIVPPESGRKTVTLTPPRPAVEYPPGTAETVRDAPSEPNRTPLPNGTADEAPPLPNAAPASRKQIAAIMARLPSPITRDDRLATLAGVLGVDSLASMSDLSTIEASAILERLPG